MKGNGTRSWAARATGALLLVPALTACDDPALSEPAVQRLSITPALDTLRVGQSRALAAVDQGGDDVAARVAWASTDSVVATVDRSGRVTALAQGATDIVARSGSAQATARLVVLAAVARVLVPEQEFVEAATATPTATIADREGNALLDREVRWSSTDTSVIRFAADGQMEARRAGTATITATSEGVSGSGRVVVRPAPLRRVFFEYLDDAIVQVGGTRPLPVVYETLSGARVHRQSSWSTSDPSVATVDSTGRVRGVAPGEAVITAASGDRTGSVTVHVLRYPTPLRFTDISVTNRRVCAVATDGSAYCWGAVKPPHLASSSPLEGVRPIGPAAPGDVGYRYTTIPVLVGEGLRFTSIRIAGDITCGLAVGGPVHCWGRGLPRTVLAAPGREYVELVVAAEIACARVATGEVDCWAPTPAGMSTTPARVPGGRLFRAIFSTPSPFPDHRGNPFVCGATVAAEAYCWRAPGATPSRVGGTLQLASLGVGTGSLCGLTPAGKAYCWGDNEYGQLGNGGRLSTTEPAEVAGGLVFTQIVVAGISTCGIAQGGAAYCWGRNSDGVLGDPTAVGPDATTPRPVSGGVRFVRIGASGQTACGIATDGVVHCWGGNYDGELGQADRGIYHTPVAVRGQ